MGRNQSLYSKKDLDKDLNDSYSVMENGFIIMKSKKNKKFSLVVGTYETQVQKDYKEMSKSKDSDVREAVEELEDFLRN
jgi:carbonic anhydrase/acetyltransferase-like protein (isoleucine patch superfamily)